jgi:N-acyl-L-homoserine lactone synthetase
MLVVDQSSRSREHLALRSMFAARKRVFVDLLGLDLPVLAGRYEIDHRDGPEATYLIVADVDCEHLASARLLPVTASCHLGPSVLASDGSGYAPHIAEITHVCLSPDIGTGPRRRARDTLLHGLVEHALAHDIMRLIGLAEPGWLQRVGAIGWTCRQLGDGTQCDGREVVPLAIDIDRTTPSRLAAAGILPPTLSEQPAS